MKRDVLVYLSGPITATDDRTVADNVSLAAIWYFDCIRRGIPAVCVHLGAAFPSAFTIDYETWMDYDLALLERCTHMLMLPRWETSAGAKRELAHVATRSIDVAYSLDELCAMLGIDARRDQPEPPCPACAMLQEAKTQ